MQPALQLINKVLPGNKIEIEIPEGEIGDTVDVFVKAIAFMLFNITILS